MKKSGFTLVELLLVISIIAIMVTITAGILNPAALNGRANDAKRKKDIGRIKVAFEEYYNDRGCYPNGTVLTDLMDKVNCFTNLSSFPQLQPWVCDPVYKTPYKISTELSSCPKWYKIYTKLDNKDDGDIPEGWNKLVGFHVGNGQYTSNEVNYGGSSTNVNWYDYVLDPSCDATGKTYGCGYKNEDGVCKTADNNKCDQNSYPNNCYAGTSDGCETKCMVSNCPLQGGL